jgi:hypothetical protein
MRSALLLSLLLLGCGDDGSSQNDAAVGGDAPSDGTSVALDCASYCTAIMGTCGQLNTQYPRIDQCVEACSTFDVGTAGAMTGNTLACRVTHLELAMSAPATHCIHAGPTGGGMCGTPCEGFCAIGTGKCASSWPNTADCLTACGMFATTSTYKVPTPSGNSFACRMYYMVQAALTANYCVHTEPVSATCQ